MVKRDICQKIVVNQKRKDHQEMGKECQEAALIVVSIIEVKFAR